MCDRLMWLGIKMDNIQQYNEERDVKHAHYDIVDDQPEKFPFFSRRKNSQDIFYNFFQALNGYDLKKSYTTRRFINRPIIPR